MKRTQSEFIFRKYVEFFYSKGYVPLAHFSTEDEARDSLIRRGFLTKDAAIEEGVRIRFWVAKANIPLEERRKLQSQIDRMPTGDIVYRPTISNPTRKK